MRETAESAGPQDQADSCPRFWLQRFPRIGTLRERIAPAGPARRLVFTADGRFRRSGFKRDALTRCRDTRRVRRRLLPEVLRLRRAIPGLFGSFSTTRSMARRSEADAGREIR